MNEMMEMAMSFEEKNLPIKHIPGPEVCCLVPTHLVALPGLRASLPGYGSMHDDICSGQCTKPDCLLPRLPCRRASAAATRTMR